MIEIFELDTATGRKRISVRSTGTGAWITVTPVCINPLKVFQIVRKLFWVQNVKDLSGLLEKC